MEMNSLNPLEGFLFKKGKIILIINLLLTFIIGYFLFDVRLSFASDDAAYINNAMALLQNGSYPHFQGPMWPFILSLTLKFLGNNLITFKMISLFSMVIGNFALYKALDKRVSPILVWAALFTTTFNAYIQAYSSSTFSESFFMMCQGFAFWSFMALNDKLQTNPNEIKKTILQWVIFGLSFFILSLAKNVAMFAIVSVIGFFLLKKQWKFAIFALAIFCIFKLPYDQFIKAKFKAPAESQSEKLLRKDYYKPELGNEDVSGFIDRLSSNYGQYVSTHVFKILGLRGTGISSLFTFEKMEEMQDDKKMESNFLLGILFLGLFSGSLFFAIKSNQDAILFTCLYTGALMGITFLALQSFWNQDRLMIIFMPFILPIMFYGIYQYGISKSLKPVITGICIIVIGLLLNQLGGSLKAISKNKANFSQFQRKDLFSSYPEPVQTYLKSAVWIKENINDSGFVIAAKPIEASVFGGLSRFKKMPQPIPNRLDSMMMFFKKNKCKYILDDQFMGQNHNLIDYLQKAAPSTISLIHEEQGYAPCSLYKLNY